MTKSLWAIAIGYPLLLAVAAFVLASQDTRLFFNQYYLLATLAIAPAFFLSLVTVIARQKPRPKLSVSASVGLWVLIVTGLHLWVIGQIARSL